MPKMSIFLVLSVLLDISLVCPSIATVHVHEAVPNTRYNNSLLDACTNAPESEKVKKGQGSGRTFFYPTPAFVNTVRAEWLLYVGSLVNVKVTPCSFAPPGRGTAGRVGPPWAISYGPPKMAHENVRLVGHHCNWPHQ